MRNSYYYYKDKVNYGDEIDVTQVQAIEKDYKDTELRNSYLSARITEMVVLKYKDGFEKTGEIGLDGYVKDRYSMDEKDNVLRVFVTLSHSRPSGNWWSVGQTNVSLYCIDLLETKVVASKVCFAPSGDEVKSARFEGDIAYVCTARRNTDPVFYFDLSDLNNITYVDTGEIDGFSVNLIKFNDLLLGIGQGENSLTLKIELYKETDVPEAENGVVSVAKYEYNCSFAYEYKAHFVNAEHNLIGLHVYDYSDRFVTSEPIVNRNKYLLLRYDAETQSLVQIYLEEFDSSSNLARAFYDHDGVYVFGENDFTFIDLQQDNA